MRVRLLPMSVGGGEIARQVLVPTAEYRSSHPPPEAKRFVVFVAVRMTAFLKQDFRVVRAFFWAGGTGYNLNSDLLIGRWNRPCITYRGTTNPRRLATLERRVRCSTRAGAGRSFAVGS